MLHYNLKQQQQQNKTRNKQKKKMKKKNKQQTKQNKTKKIAFVRVYLKLLACNFVQETGIEIKAYACVHFLFLYVKYVFLKSFCYVYCLWLKNSKLGSIKTLHMSKDYLHDFGSLEY